MRTSFYGLHVAVSGLNTARGNLNVTAHNLANAEIPGYSRQVTQMQAGRPLTLGDQKGMYGTGSRITSIIQIRDRFLDRKYWEQSAIHGQFSAVHQHLSFVETVFNNVNDAGTQKIFNSFFSTLQYLTQNAHQPGYRTNVTTYANTLAEQVRQNAFALQRQQQDLNREFADVIVSINSLGQQIANVNGQIHIFERNGENANDLRDQRALLIDQLSELVNVQVEERDFSRPGMSYDRRLTVMINGYDFIDHTRINRLELVERENPDDTRAGAKRNEMDVHGLYEVFFELTGSRFNIHSQTLSGKLRGIVDVRDGNGGQITAPNQLTGRLLVQNNISALERTSNFFNSLVTQFSDMAGGLGAAVAARDASLATLGNSANTSQARAHFINLVNIRNERTSLNSSLPARRNAIVSQIGATNLRNSIAAVADLNDNPALETALNNLTAHMNSANATPSSITNIAELDAFETRLREILEELQSFGQFGGPLEGRTAILDSIAARINDLSDTTAPLRRDFARLDAIEAEYGTVAALDAQIDAANTALTNLNAAIRTIDDIVNFGSRIETQMQWAIRNTEDMIGLVLARIEELENQTSTNARIREEIRDELNGFRQFLEIAEQELENMRALANAIEIPPSVGNYSGLPELNTLVDALNAAISGIGGGFPQSIATIVAASSGELVEGRSINRGTTTIFKGIPFYMNQLNHLVRTFSRALNEGRNADGYDMLQAATTDGTKTTKVVGHVFGYDANGENRNALFFTFADSLNGAPGVLDSLDPFLSLRMWVLSEVDEAGIPTGRPARDENGQLITVQDPNPPVDAQGRSLVATDDMGRPMFTVDYDRFNALNFIVNPELLDDPALLAASSDHNNGEAFNDVVLGFLQVWNEKGLFREGRLIDFIIATSNHLGVDTQQAKLFRDNYHEITTQTENHRLSVKSVDSEEEILNMVRFQNWFIASSKLINVIDTVYDTLINRLGNF
ncbi:MAG: flagellar hook-associated protein FlgK [Defluviitaleaceae bacterium]|nr:flagellar hook-associated protein FlgK [Defluviitaleaceae bacterium]